ncbi:MAG: hypothetical protein JXA54_10770 [Candidatus Heimdallarchaeota archaeon]|nr:hypothetical protein [Candidatus Heimdallarchaeota archaeon]
MNKTKTLFFFFVVPLILIVLYTISLFNEFVAQKFGGLSNISSFLIVLLTYLYVLLTARMIQKTAEIQNQERRPYILLDFEFIEDEVYIILSNTGKLPAFDLVIDFEPDIKTIFNEGLKESLFSNPIRFFPPGKIFRSFIGSGEDMLKDREPKTITLMLHYLWQGKKKPEQESYLINLDHYKKCNYVRETNTQEKIINNQLEKIGQILSNLESLLKNLTDEKSKIKS